MIGRAVLSCLLGLALTGCNEPERTVAAEPAGGASSSPTVTTSTPTSVASTPAPTTPTPTKPAPTTPAAPQCQQNKGWSRKQTVEWVTAVTDTDSLGGIAVGENATAAIVCQKVQIQVEFWKVTFTGGVKISYVIKSVRRKQLSIDGNRAFTVKLPADFSSGACTGTMLAVYVGKPLRAAELPATLDIPTGATTLSDVKFRSDRIAYSIGSFPIPVEC